MYVTGCRSPDVCTMYVHVQPFDVLYHIHVLGIARSPDVPYLPLSVVSSQVPLFSSCLPLSVPFPYPVLIWCCKSDSSYDDVKVELKGLHSHFENVQLERNPAYGEVTPSQAQTEPQPYEEFVAVGGVTSDSVAMEENPADQSIDTTESQTEESLYL